jgi:2-iminoacetate synthase ThiH
MQTRTRQPVSDETINDLARQLADYRLGGCPSGGSEAVSNAVRKAAKAHGRSYSELWSDVHRAAYEIIDAEMVGR